MSTERDELRGKLGNTICNASLYAERAQPYLLDSDMSNVLDKTADAVLAWIEERYVPKPRTITTVEELDAAILSTFEDGGYLVLSDRRGRPWTVWSDEDGDEVVSSWPQEEDPEWLTLAEIDLPATVLNAKEPTK